MNIDIEGVTFDRLQTCASADIIEKDGMVTTIAQEGVTIVQHGETIDYLKVRDRRYC